MKNCAIPLGEAPRLSVSMDFFDFMENNKQEKVVSHILAGKVDVNGLDENGYPPLFYALEKGCFDIAKALLKQGAYTCEQYGKECKTPLHVACQNGDLNCAKLLVNSCVDINEKSLHGYTPLSIMNILNKEYDLVEFLIRNGADINVEMVLLKMPWIEYVEHTFRLNEMDISMVANWKELYKETTIPKKRKRIKMYTQ